MVAYIWVIFLINPILGGIFCVLGLYKDKKQSINYAVMLAVLFASFAYWFIPSHEMDLTRYFDQLRVYNGLDWNVFYTQILKNEILFLQEVLFYVIAQTNNYHLLPAIVVFIVYFIIFYMVTDYGKRNNIKSKEIIKTLLFIICVLPFPSIVSNVRNILAFSIFTLGVYREYEQKKCNVITWLLYICPIFIHISSMALLLIRLAISFWGWKKKLRLFIGLLITTSPFIINKFAPFLMSRGEITSAFFTKANNYINATDTGYALYLQSNLFMKIQKIYFICIVIFLMVAFTFSYIDKNKKKLENTHIKDESKIMTFFIFICCVVIGTIPIVLTVYMRFTFIVIMLSFLVLMKRRSNIKYIALRQLVTLGMIIGAVGGLLHQITFMSKMTDISKMFINVLVRSCFNMFIG